MNNSNSKTDPLVSIALLSLERALRAEQNWERVKRDATAGKGNPKEFLEAEATAKNATTTLEGVLKPLSAEQFKTLTELATELEKALNQSLRG